LNHYDQLETGFQRKNVFGPLTIHPLWLVVHFGQYSPPVLGVVAGTPLCVCTLNHAFSKSPYLGESYLAFLMWQALMSIPKLATIAKDQVF
jgi:hypothetical protein